MLADPGSSSSPDLLGLLESVKRLKANEQALRAKNDTLAEHAEGLAARIVELERRCSEQKEQTETEALRGLRLAQELELLQATIDQLKAEVADLTASNAALRASRGASSEQILGEEDSELENVSLRGSLFGLTA